MLNEEILEQLRFLGEDDPEFVRDMIRGFLDEAAESVYTLGELAPEALERLCHKLQGAGANVGAKALPELFQQIRADLKTRPESVPELLGRVPSLFEQTKKALLAFAETL